MALAKVKSNPYFSVEEYLKYEREADERSELIDGEIYAMAGESPRHGDVSMNIAGILHNQLRRTNCRGRIKDTKIKSGALKERLGKGMISYPDVVVICGEPEYHDKHKDVVLNPTVIIEVLSESTADFDRGVKFTRYRMFNPTLSDYILIWQDEPVVEHYIRQASGDWLLKEYHGLDKSFQIDSIECSLNLADVYERVEFE